MSLINAYAVTSAGGRLDPWTYQPGPIGPSEVEVEVSHCGLCHSDVHLIDNDWHISRFPLVPGHEVIGIVREIGEGVRGLAVGARVGVGWQASGCFECGTCRSGNEHLCPSNVPTCVGHFGGFADRVRADYRCAIPIPQAMPSDQAAPLLCGGITVYAPLARFGVQPRTRVAVAGIGGLGHLAVQFARVFGAHVTAISTSADKAAEARALGADDFLVSGDADQMTAATGAFDLLIVTAPGDFNWASYLSLVAINGELAYVGGGLSNLDVPPFMLVGKQTRVSGSATGTPRLIAEMLEVAARRGVLAQIERMPMRECNAAVERVRRNQARYRIVLEA